MAWNPDNGADPRAPQDPKQGNQHERKGWDQVRASLLESLQDEVDSARDQIFISEVAREWKTICYGFGLKLSLPCIRLSDSHVTLGSWEPASRTLTISRQAILSLSWDSVVGLLKHEMAHQFVDESMGAPVDTVHGKEFQMACDRLGLLPPFRSGHLKLDDLRERRDRLPSLPETLKRKLSRLEALASSPNAHESVLARERIQNIRASLAELAWDLNENDQQVFARKVISLGRQRVAREQSLAAGILSSHFGVQVIFDDEFSLKMMARTKTIVLLGRPDKIEMAEFVFHFLVDEAHRAWTSYRQKTQASLREAASFKTGVLEGFRTGLGDSRSRPFQDRRPTGGHHAEQQPGLERATENDQALRQFVATQFPRLRSQTLKTSLASARAQRQGHEFGRSIILPRPVSKGAGQQSRGSLASSRPRGTPLLGSGSVEG